MVWGYGAYLMYPSLPGNRGSTPVSAWLKAQFRLWKPHRAGPSSAPAPVKTLKPNQAPGVRAAVWPPLSLLTELFGFRASLQGGPHSLPCLVKPHPTGCQSLSAGTVLSALQAQNSW